MRSLVLAMFLSLDGYACGPNGEFVPPAWSDDLETHWSGYGLGRAGHLLYGRANFLFNRDFWLPAETDSESPAAGISYAGTMNRLPKTVVSTTLTGDPGWNAEVAQDLAGAVARLKAEDGGDIFSFGGPTLARSLVALDLPDEYRLMITPNLLGAGKRVFDGGFAARDLELIEARPLDTGAAIVHYRRK